MKKIKIGIPRALFYYQYGILWKTFFEKIGCNLVISPETNNIILNLGEKNTPEECCLPYKIYIGHVIALAETCDYILTAKICTYGEKYEMCHRFKYIDKYLKNIILKEKILCCNIEHTKYNYMLIELIRLGFKITPNPIKIIYSYLYAKKKQTKYNINKFNENKNSLTSQNKKVLILSNDYNIQDKYIGNYIKYYLKNNDIKVILSNYLEYKSAIKFAEYSLDQINIKYSKEILGALHYYKYQVDGIIYISVNKCEKDSIIKELIIKNNISLPFLNIVISDNVNNATIETELEYFIDIINKKQF